MQYSPKLKKAAEEIKTILKRYDIGAQVVLHTPGFSEFINHFTPGYSCLRLEQGGTLLRFRAKLKEDFNGDKAAWTKKVGDTTNMLVHFRDTAFRNFQAYSDLLQKLKKTIEIDEKPGNITGHTEQNN